MPLMLFSLCLIVPGHDPTPGLILCDPISAMILGSVVATGMSAAGGAIFGGESGSGSAGGQIGQQLFSGIGSGIQNALNASAAMDQQKEMLDYQVDKQKEFFDYQNEYNTPENQYERLSKVGVNPNVAFSQGLGNAGNSAMQYSTPAMARTGLDFAALMEEMNLKKKSADLEAEYAKSDSAFRDQRLASLMLTNQGQQVMNALNRLEVSFKSKYGEESAKWMVNHLKADASHLLAQANKALIEGDWEKFNYDLEKKFAYYRKQLETMKLEGEAEQARVSALYAIDYMAALITQLKTQSESNKASAYKSYQEGNYFNELGISESRFRDDLAKIHHYNARLLERKNWKDNYTMGQQLQEYFNTVERSGLINDEIRQEIQMAITRNDFEAARQAVSIISEATSTISNAYGMKLGQQAADAKTEIARKWNDYNADRKKVIGFGSE